MGVILHTGANMMPLIGALYGWPTVIGGWAAHLANSIVIGVIFALIVSRPLVREQLTSVSEYTAAGLVYAAAVGLVMTGIVIPVAMQLLRVQTFPESLLPIPGVIGGVLVIISIGVAHMIFGLLLGATCGFLWCKLPDPTPSVHTRLGP
nr:hypothetical protein [Halalkalicoccus sp. NIPERK01]